MKETMQLTLLLLTLGVTYLLGITVTNFLWWIIVTTMAVLIAFIGYTYNKRKNDRNEKG